MRAHRAQKTQKSLVNTDFSGTPKATENSISENISKKIEYPMISAKAVSYTEGYRSGHNEAVLKTVWAHAHKGSNPFPSAINPKAPAFGFFYFIYLIRLLFHFYRTKNVVDDTKNL